MKPTIRKGEITFLYNADNHAGVESLLRLVQAVLDNPLIGRVEMKTSPAELGPSDEDLV